MVYKEAEYIKLRHTYSINAKGRCIANSTP